VLDIEKFKEVKFSEHCFWTDLVDDAYPYANAEYGLIRKLVEFKSRISKQRVINYYEFNPEILN
jgi:hypothetical protein